MNNKFKIDFKKELNKAQYQVVIQGDGACLVLAGAGSGKTRTLVYRVAYLIESGVDPTQILLLTFTNKASREMMDRVRGILKLPVNGLWGGTFHHIANRILRRYCPKLGYEHNFTIMDSDDSKNFIKLCMNECGVDKKDKSFPKADVVLKIISFATNSCLPVQEVIAERYTYLNAYAVDVIIKISDYYKVKKRNSNVMDFDDLLYNWDCLLREYPEIARSLGEKFQYILVDEYQDTNRIQGSLIRRMVGSGGNILVVGDDSQSIYSFRAATISNIMDFEEVYPQAKIYKLETNYRSTPEILSLANASIGLNRGQYEKKLISTFEPGESPKPYLAPVKNNFSQAEYICKRIKDLRETGVGLSEIAVLFRSSFQTIDLEMQLNRLGIPYVMRGGMRFFQQAHIKDVMGYLKIIDNPHDELAWKRSLMLYEGIGSSAAHKVWREIKKGRSLSEMIILLGGICLGKKAQASLSQIHSLLTDISELDKNKAAGAIKLVLDYGYKSIMQRQFENYSERLADVEYLIYFSAQYVDLAEFLAEITLSEGFSKESVQDAGREELVLSTIHQSKGLEWKAVFIMGLADGVFPHYKVFDIPAELAEERRLFYVAVTRAKKSLYCLYPMNSFSHATGTKHNHPSVFITEVSSDLFDVCHIPGIFCADFGQGEHNRTYNVDGDFTDDAVGGVLDRVAGINNRRKNNKKISEFGDDGFFQEDVIEY